MGTMIEIDFNWSEPNKHEANENSSAIANASFLGIRESRPQDLVYYNCDCVEASGGKVKFVERFMFYDRLIEAGHEHHDEHDVIDYKLS